jgi:sialate O-acetylesterase
MHLRFLPSCALLSVALFNGSLLAELKLPAVIGDHMVLQQKLPNPIWGWDLPGTDVKVSFAGQSKSAKAGPDGKWSVTLDPVGANAQPQTLEVAAGTQKVVLQDVLVGEVWMCSGQSNMEMPVGGDWNGDLEAVASNYPNLRLIRVPISGGQEIQNDFKGAWASANAATVRYYSAVGYFFGRYLHQTLGVPVGLINNSWGGSAAEAWIRRGTLEADPRFTSLMENTRKTEAYNQGEQAKKDFDALMERHNVAAQKAKEEGRPAPRPPTSPEAWLKGNQRPGNIFAGMVHPTLGYGLKGVIWYQGESNAGRAWEYRDLFPFLIEQWRKEQRQPELSFYWVQLADYRNEDAQPVESGWAELREAQTNTLALPHTGQAVIIDLGEGKDIHPKNKHDVAARLVRWALAKDYGISIPYRSPEYKGMEVQGDKVLVTIDCFGGALRTFDVEEAVGFAVCGQDRVWHWAKGRLVGKDKVELSCSEVPQPVAVRYAWANNPVCNLTSMEGLPLTPFRTDDFEPMTKPKPAPAAR